MGAIAIFNMHAHLYATKTPLYSLHLVLQYSSSGSSGSYFDQLRSNNISPRISLSFPELILFNATASLVAAFHAT